MGASCALDCQNVKRALGGKYNSTKFTTRRMFPCACPQVNVIVLDILDDKFLAVPAVDRSSTAVFHKPRIRAPKRKGKQMIDTTLCGGVFRRMLGAAVFALASAGAAQAAVITFEGHSGPAFNQDSIREAGYTITFLDPAGDAPAGTVQVGRFINGSDPTTCPATSICPTNNPTTYFDLFNTGFIDILPTVGGSTFTFSGLDASFIAMTGVQYPVFPAAVQVIGFRADDSFSTIQFNLPDTGFQHFDVTDAAGGAAFAQERFTEIAIVSFRCDASGNCTGLDNGNGQVGLDNIALSDVPTSPVPEPASASLLAVGLLGLSMGRRRRT
jgi:hypothetical protein